MYVMHNMKQPLSAVQYSMELELSTRLKVYRIGYNKQFMVM